MSEYRKRLFPSILAIVLLAALASLTLHGVTAQVATGDFSVSISNTSVSIPEGGSATLGMYVASLNGFSQTITLTYSGHSGISATFNGNGPNEVPTSADATSSTTATIFVDSSVSPGTYPLEIIGASPTGQTHRVGLWVTVTPAEATPDFMTQPLPSMMTLTPGLSRSTTILLSSVNGFSSTISLSAAWTGLAPYGVTLSLPSPVTVPAGSSASSTLTLTADSSPSTGTYALVVTASNGVISHATDITVTIYGAPAVLAPVTPEFSITSSIAQPSPATITLSPGASQSANIILSSVNGLTSTVTLSAGWDGVAPSDVSVTSPSPVTITIPSSGSASSTLTFAAGSSPSTGSYTLVVTASNGVTSLSTDIAVLISSSSSVPAFAPVTPSVLPNDFSVHPSTDTVSVIPGLSTGTSVVVNSLGSFSAPVTFSTSWVGNAPTDLAVDIPETVTPPAQGQAASPITFQTTALASTGTYILQVTATSGSVSHSTDITLQVNQPGPFVIWPSLTNTVN